ncbi:MAG: hypothetical protein K0Q59_3663, partial [Paenibacillus sp.]|nr:hypothetical protein [Paenibacillus sp.]
MTMTGWNEKDKKHDTAATFGGTGHRLAKIAKNTAIIGLMAAMATACSSGGSTDSKSAGDTKGATETKAPEKNKEPITLNFYSTSGDYDSAAFMKMFGDKIQAKFPYITVKHIDRVAGVSVENLITAGQTLDIMYLSIGQTNELTNVKLEYDISNLIKANKFDTSRLEPTTVELQKLVANGGMYGLPVFNNTITTYYNKDLFDKFGVGYPKDGNTWDDIYDLTKKVARTDGGIQYQGFTLSMSHNMLVNQYSIPYTDKDNKVLFNTDPFKKLFETWTKFYHLPGNEVTDKTVNYTTQVNSFDKERTTAMFLGL